MSILIFAIIVVLIVAMLVYAVDLLPFASPPLNGIAKFLIIIVGALLILNRAGVV